MGSNFSITNLRRDVENSAEKFGLPDWFESRFAKNELDATDLGVSLQRLDAGASMPFAHRHPKQPEELYVVVAGSGTITVDDVEHPLAAWDAMHVAGPAVRTFSAGDEGLELLAFGRIQPADAEMVETSKEGES